MSFSRISIALTLGLFSVGGCGLREDGSNSSVSSSASSKTAATPSAKSGAAPTVGKPFADKMCQLKTFKSYYDQGFASARGIAKADEAQAKIDGAAAGQANAESAALLLTAAQGTKDGDERGKKEGFDDTYVPARNLASAGAAIEAFDRGQRAGYDNFKNSPDATQRGYSEGLADGQREVESEAYAEGETEGKEKGTEKGLDEGKEAGQQDGEREGEIDGEVWHNLRCSSQSQAGGLELTAAKSTTTKKPKVPLPNAIVCPEIGSLNGKSSNALFVSAVDSQAYCVQLACSKVSNPTKKVSEAAYTSAFDRAFSSAKKLNVAYWSAYQTAYQPSFKIGQADGTKQGREEGTREGTEAGYDKGFEKGTEQGNEEAEAKGRAAGREAGRNDFSVKAAAHEKGYQAAFGPAEKAAYHAGYDMTHLPAFNNSSLMKSAEPCEG